MSELRLAWGLRNFRFKLGASLAFGAAAGVYTTLSLYMGTYFWEFSAEQLAGLVAPAVLATIFAFLTLNRLGIRFDKHTLLCAASLLMGFNMFWMVGLRLFGLLPANGHPVLYPMMLLTAFIGVYCVIAVQVLSVSLIADLVDEQELKTQKRQEGIYFAASMFINKATTGLGALIGGIIIDLAGVQAGAAPGSVAESILTALGGFYTGVIGGFSVIAYWFYRRINLGRAQLQEVQDALKRVQAESLSA